MFKRKNKKIVPLLAFALASLIWGVNTVFLKTSVDAMPVSLFLFIRFSLAGLILLPFTLRRYKKMKRTTWLRIIIASVVGISIFMLFMGTGLRQTSALNAALIFLLGPIFMYVLSIEMLREKFSAKILLGLVVGLSGALLVVVSPLLNGVSGSLEGSFRGNVIVAISVFISVLGTIIIKPVLKKTPALQVTTIRFLVVAVSMIPVLYLQRHDVAEVVWTKDVIFSVAFTVIMGSVVAYTLYHWSLKRISGEESSVLHYLDPLGGVLAAIFILGDQLTPVVLLGGGLTVIGIYLAEIKTRPHLHHFGLHR